MPVRDSMRALIQYVRDLTTAPASADAGDVAFSDQQVQNYLDKRRITVRYALLRAEEFLQPGGQIVYKDFYSEWDYWEADAALYSNNYTPFTSEDFVEQDFLTGHWAFTAAQLPLVYIIGKTYDIYGSAADLCEAWASQLTESYDFSDKQVKFSRSQMYEMKMKQAQAFKRQAKPRTVSQGRSDVEDGSGNSALQAAIQRILTNPF